MSLLLRPSQQRGLTQTDWLTSWHSFSFAEYVDPDFVEFGYLRVINEDIIQPNGGFGLHAHRNMEIITYVISGALRHQDSLGNGSVITPGDIQRMSAGRGIQHSEFNASDTQLLHLLQIWIKPNQTNLPPSYEQKKIHLQRNHWIMLASPNPDPHAVTIHQNTQIWIAYLDPQQTLSYSLNQRTGWLQVIDGNLLCNDLPLHAGDGVGIISESTLSLQCLTPATVLWFDMDV
jgi:redox-sensitive bicupin YhaK (pirin superfamily)